MLIGKLSKTWYLPSRPILFPREEVYICETLTWPQDTNLPVSPQPFGCCLVATWAFTGGCFSGQSLGYTQRSCLLSLGCLLSPGLALAFHDGSVHIVHRLSLQMMAVFYGSSSQRPVDEQTIKRQRTAGPLVHFKAMQLSWTSLALAGIDSHGKVLCSVMGGCVSSSHPGALFISLSGDGSFRKVLGMLLPAVCSMLNKKGCIPLPQELYLWVRDELQLSMCCVVALWSVFNPVLDRGFPLPLPFS